MQKLSFALSILVLPFAFHSVRAQAAQTKAGTAMVSGRVTLKGEPARGVMVVLQKQNQIASNTPRAKTDESGRFHFSGVPAGRYSVYAAAPGYVSPEDTNISMRGKTINLADGEKVENVDLEIKRGGVIAGRVIDSQGRPVIEERINLSKVDANNRPRASFVNGANYEMYQTDDRGFYRIYGLPEGRYLVSVGYAVSSGSAIVASRREYYPRVFYPNATSESEAKAIEVSEDSEATNIDIIVTDPKQTHDVYGRVVDAGSGQPVAGVEIMIAGASSAGVYTGGYRGSGARSGPNGEFRLFGVAPGRYAILARPDESSSGFISDPMVVDIGEDTVTGVELKVRQGATISGVVVIEGTNDPKVLAKLSQIGLSGIVRPTTQGPPLSPSRLDIKVNADGSFRVGGLQTGKAFISSVNIRDLVVARIELNGAPVDRGIEVDAGQPVTGVRIILVHGSLAIRGELKLVGGAAPAGCRFFATARSVAPPSLNTPGAEIDARGQFVIENSAPGEYEIGVAPYYSLDSQPLSPEIRRLISSVKERVVLSGANQQQVTLVLDLSQKVRDQ
jgi:protocatechuate 3,4-dioxygenase beta subunit